MYKEVRIVNVEFVAIFEMSSAFVDPVDAMMLRSSMVSAFGKPLEVEASIVTILLPSFVMRIDFESAGDNVSDQLFVSCHAPFAALIQLLVTVEKYAVYAAPFEDTVIVRGFCIDPSLQPVNVQPELALAEIVTFVPMGQVPPPLTMALRDGLAVTLTTTVPPPVQSVVEGPPNVAPNPVAPGR